MTDEGHRDVLDRFFDVSLDLLCVAELGRGKLLRANGAWQRTLGWSVDDLLANGWFPLVHPDDVDRTERELERLAQGHTTSCFENRLRTKAGNYRWLRWAATSILDAGLIYASAHDVTDRRVAAERDRLLFDRSPSPMWLLDAETFAIVDVNQATLALYGYTRSELMGMTIRDIIVEDEHSDMAGHVTAVVETGGTRIPNRRHRTKGGMVLDVEVTAHRLELGERPAILSVITDVTERKRAVHQLHASEQRYRRIVENTSEGVWMYDATATTTFMNRRMAELLGIRPEDAVGTSIYSFMHEADLAEARRRVARRIGGVSERGEFRLKRHDGSDLWVSLHADPLLDKNGKFEMSLALVTDIGDRRRAEETRSLLASIVTSSGNAIISRGIDGKIKTWNVGAERLTQYTAEEAIGQSIDMLFRPRSSNQGDVDRDRLDRGEMIDQYETVIVRKDGSPVEVSLSSGILDNEHGEVLGVSIIAHNISERRRAEAELRRTEEQLRQAQKMEAIGSLAGGVAHDFNNILSVILSYAEMNMDMLAPSDPLRADLAQISQAGLRATALTRQLLAFSRKQILQPTSLDLNEVLRNVQKMLDRVVGEDIELTVVPAHEPMHIHADAGQIEQVLMNLVVNARDAIPRAGHVTIETAAIQLDDTNAAEHPGVRPGKYVMLTTTDSGVGIAPEILSRIFEPFFTTKDKSKGTGLGLSTVFGIVKQSGGYIGVDSELGRGTTFKVYLPRTSREERSQPLPILDANASFNGTETILLVEDETPVRNLMRTILRKRGYNVLEAENAGDAFLQCEQFQGPIHLMVTDVVMPRMSGRQLADRLELQRPDMSVLFVSGYTEDAIVRHGVMNAGLEFLSKPITPETLVRKVREVLDTPGAPRGSVLHG